MREVERPIWLALVIAVTLGALALAVWRLWPAG